MKVKFKLLLSFLLLGMFQLNAQNIIVSGTVKTEDGKSLSGVSILLKGTKIGTTTSQDGKFELKSLNNNAVLVVSFTGMNSKEYKIGSKRIFDIVLEPEVKGLNEVVVVGYGELRKRDITGSVSQYKNENSTENPNLSTAQMLQGKLAGVNIGANTGAPGAASLISIRGASSISGSNQPLIVIDGLAIDNVYVNPSNTDAQTNFTAGSIPPTDILSTINPNDIASIEVLKDASASAIYGSRASNGVILITTKKGLAGEPKISYTARIDLNTVRRKIDVLNTSEFIEFGNEARRNAGVDSLYKSADIERLSKLNLNWQDLMFQTGITQEHQLSVSGGDVRSKFSIVGGYTDTKGTLKNAYYKRGNLRLNFSRDIGKRLNLSLNSYAASVQNSRLPQGSRTTISDGSIISSMLMFRPFDQPFDSLGDPNLLIQANPLTVVTLQTDLLNTTQLISSLGLNYKLAKNLTATYDASVNYNITRRDLYYPRGTNAGNQTNGRSFLQENKSRNFLTGLKFNYINTWNKKHSLNAVMSFDAQLVNTRGFSILGSNYPNDILQGNRLGLAGLVSAPFSSLENSTLLSVVNRFVYSYDKRFIFTVTNRADGSSRLASGNKWKYFPSGGFSWNISNEKFFKSKLLSELKFRTSYGIVGNQSVGIGASQQTMSTFTGFWGNGIQTGIGYTNVANPDLTWEVTSQSNFGLDFSIKNGLIKGSIDVYNKNTTNLLLNYPLPQSTGFGTYQSNAGEISNKGLELQLSTRIIKRNNFSWLLDFNYSYNRNKVISIGELSTITGPNFFPVFQLNRPINIIRPGSPIGSFFGFKTNGVYQNAAEVAQGAEPTAKPGDIRFVDISGPNGKPDGIINDFDQTIIGNPNPDFIFGFNNTFKYKKFTVAMLIQGVIGQEIANVNRLLMDALFVPTTGNQLNVRREAWENRWRGEGTSNYYPAANTNAPFKGRVSDFIVEDGSFVRLRTLTLSYDFAFKKHVKQVKLFLTGTNLLTITNYKGYDPEVNVTGNQPISQGIDSGTIPVMRTYSFGVNVNF